MSYPHIAHISDVLGHIEGDSAFAVKAKDCGNTYINYLHMGTDVFPPRVDSMSYVAAGTDSCEHHVLDLEDEHACMRRECRGISFDTATGVLTSRPFHKFFNAGEREEVALDKLPFGTAHVIMDKMDGSMIRPVWVGDVCRWGTKMGLTDVAAIAESFVQTSDIRYTTFAQACREQGLTPIFEFVSRRNRIVVDYAQERMVLLAVRHNLTGNYCSRTVLENFNAEFGVPLVEIHPSTSLSSAGLSAWDTGTTAGRAEKFVQSVRQSQDIDEGVVVSWGAYGDLMVKVKTEDYTRLHSAKDKMATERRLIGIIRAEDVDDLLPLLPSDQKEALLEYVDSFWECHNRLACSIGAMYIQLTSEYASKKDLALSPWGKASENRHWLSLIFSIWDGKLPNAAAAVDRVLDAALASETKWEEAKNVWGITLNWNGMEDTDE